MRHRPHQQNYRRWLDGWTARLAERTDIGQSPIEVAGVILFDANVNPACDDPVHILARGDENSVAIHYSEFITKAWLNVNARYIVKFHNHPAPHTARPSAADYTVCRGLGKRLDSWKVLEYLDDIIVTANVTEWYSFRLGWQDNHQFGLCRMPRRFWHTTK